MNVQYDKPSRHKEIADVIVRSVKLHVSMMGLDHWDIQLSWNSVEDKFGAECEAWPEYYRAELNFDLDTLSGKTHQINEYVRHELLHCLLWWLADAGSLLSGEDDGAKALIRKAEERVTTDLERMPLWNLLDK